MALPTHMALCCGNAACDFERVVSDLEIFMLRQAREHPKFGKPKPFLADEQASVFGIQPFGATRREYWNDPLSGGTSCAWLPR